MPIPHDCRDGFLMAYWRRPEAYLDPVVRPTSPSSRCCRAAEVDAMVAALRADLESGAWAAATRRCWSSEELDFGYRVLVAE